MSAVLLHSKLIIKGSALSILQMFLQVAVSFFLMPFIISHLGKELYGVWILIGSFVGYYGLLDLGIGGSIMRFVSRAIGADKKEEIKYYISSAFFILSAAGILLILISIAVSLLAGFFIADAEKLYLFKFAVLVLGTSIGISFPLRVFDGFLSANLRVDLKRIIEIVQIFYRTTLVIISLEMGYGVWGLAIVTAVSTLIDFLLKTLFALKIDPTLKIRLEYFSIQTINEMKDFTFFNFVQSLSSILIKKIDPFMVALFSQITSVAYYGVALSLAGYCEELFRAFLMILFPIFSQKEGSGNIESIRRILITVSRICIITASFIGCMTVFYSKQFLERWLGSSFLASYPLLVLLIVPLLFSLGFLPSVFVLNTLGKHRLNTYFDIIQGILNLFLSVLFGYVWGAMGVALGTAIPLILFGGFVKSYFACKTINLSIMDYWSKMFFSMFTALLLIVPIWIFCGQDIESSYVSIIKILLIHVIIFVIGGYFTLLPKTEVKLIREMIVQFFNRNKLIKVNKK